MNTTKSKKLLVAELGNTEACANGNLKTVKLLLKHGAGNEILTINGETAVDIAKALKQNKIVKLLGESK